MAWYQKHHQFDLVGSMVGSYPVWRRIMLQWDCWHTPFDFIHRITCAHSIATSTTVPYAGVEEELPAPIMRTLGAWVSEEIETTPGVVKPKSAMKAAQKTSACRWFMTSSRQARLQGWEKFLVVNSRIYQRKCESRVRGKVQVEGNLEVILCFGDIKKRFEGYIGKVLCSV